MLESKLKNDETRTITQVIPRSLAFGRRQKLNKSYLTSKKSPTFYLNVFHQVLNEFSGRTFGPRSSGWETLFLLLAFYFRSDFGCCLASQIFPRCNLLIPRNNSLMSALKKLGSDSFYMDIFSARLHRDCLKTSLAVCLDEIEH